MIARQNNGGPMKNSTRSFHKYTLLACVAAAMLAATAYSAEPAREDSVAIATSLEKQAAEFRALADKHDNMAKMHRGGAGSSKANHEGIVQHCNSISEDLRAAANESEKLAAEYRKEASK
jgi:hypothetical protein